MLPARPVSRIMNAPARDTSGRIASSLAALLAPMPLVALVALVDGSPRSRVAPPRQRAHDGAGARAGDRAARSAAGGRTLGRCAERRDRVPPRPPARPDPRAKAGRSLGHLHGPDSSLAGGLAARRRGRVRPDANIGGQRRQAHGSWRARRLDDRRRRTNVPRRARRPRRRSPPERRRMDTLSCERSAPSRTSSRRVSSRASECDRSSSIPPRARRRSRSRPTRSSSSRTIIAS